MEKIKSSLSNMILVLVGVALIVGAILAYVNHITEGPIRTKAEQTLAEGIKKVMGSSDISVAAPEVVNERIDGKQFSFTIHKVNNAAGQSIGSAVESATMGFGGELKVLVGFDANGCILGYTILSTSETPGLGMKAGTWFQKGNKGTIIGLNPKDGELHVSKDDKTGNAIDAITASTITSRAFLKAINQAYKVYMKHNQKESQTKQERR